MLASSLAGCTGACDQATTTSTTYYVHTDHLGTPKAATDDNQDVVWEAVHLPFGDTEILTKTITLNQRFPGQYYDEETGLHYNMMREYGLLMKRYAQSDLVGRWVVPIPVGMPYRI